MLEQQRRRAVPSEGGAGFAGTPAEMLAIWEASADRWPAAGPPWRPSAGDLALYRRLAGARLSGRVLVLGVTPELRDAVAAAGGRSVVVDVSARMHAVATSLLRRADPSRETWINQDWLDVDLPVDEFDLVLGDMIWWSLSVRDQHALGDRIHAALREDGLLVSRLRFADLARVDESAASVFGRYLQELDRAPEEERTIRGTLYSWLYDHTADAEGRRLDGERAREVVLGLAARPELARHEEYLRGFAARLPGPSWTSQAREELLGIVGERFELEQEERADDYDSALYPVTAFRPA